MSRLGPSMERALSFERRRLPLFSPPVEDWTGSVPVLIGCCCSRLVIGTTGGLKDGKEIIGRGVNA